MIDLDLSFEDEPWRRAIDALQTGGTMSAISFLPLIENEEEDTIMEAFEAMDQKRITLNVEDLPRMAGSGEQAVRLRLEQQLAESGDLTEGLTEHDTLRMYIEELDTIAGTQNREELLKAHLNGDKKAAPELLNAYLPQVVEIARSYTGRGVLLMDLIQEGSLGLWQGIVQYTDGDFIRHCQWWIRQYLAKAVFMQARAGGLGQKLKQGMEDYRDVDQKLLTELGRNATLEEIADAMHVTPDEASVYETMIRQARERQMVDKALHTPKEEQAEDEQAVEDTAYFHQRERIMELLSILPEQDAKLLSLRFGLEGGLPLNVQDTGEKLGLTPKEVVEREAAALAKLRQQG